MILSRNLLKASDISSLTNIEKLELLAFTKKQCEENDFDPSLFCGLKEKNFNGFELNNSLKVWDGSLLNNLDSSSKLIKALKSPQKSSLIIYPQCIRDEINKRILQIKSN